MIKVKYKKSDQYKKNYHITSSVWYILNLVSYKYVICYACKHICMWENNLLIHKIKWKAKLLI